MSFRASWDDRSTRDERHNAGGHVRGGGGRADGDSRSAACDGEGLGLIDGLVLGRSDGGGGLLYRRFGGGRNDRVTSDGGRSLNLTIRDLGDNAALHCG